jgi:hypothetical protein
VTNRLFTFGCSFTRFFWPTWADILGREFYQHINDGQVGAGNLYIFIKLITAIQQHNINKDDTVAIMWTNVLREDRFINGQWHTYGHIYNNDFFSPEFIEKYVDERGCFERDLPLIHAAQMLLDSIGCRHHILSMVDITNPEQYKHKDPTQDISHLMSLYHHTLSRIKPSVHKVIFNYDWDSRPIPRFKVRNLHPYPLEHLEFLEKVLPEYTISDDTRKFTALEDQWAQERWSKHPRSRSLV